VGGASNLPTKSCGRSSQKAKVAAARVPGTESRQTGKEFGAKKRGKEGEKAGWTFLSDRW